jgi:hypothetical protein
LAAVPDFIAVLGFFEKLPAWFSTRVGVCVFVAVALLVFSFLLRGLQKLATIAAVGALVLGVYWFSQDVFAPRSAPLPAALQTELNGLAARTLDSPEAKVAWAELQREWTKLSGAARERLVKGGDAAREAIAQRLDARASEFRQAGKKGAAEELQRLRGKVAP